MATNDIGRVTPIWRGFYSAATTYELNDIVIDTAGSVWWHKSEELTTGVIPEAGEIWDAVIDMSIFSGLIQAAITTAQTALAAAQAALAEVTADADRAETAADNAENSAAAASESAAGVGALAQAAAASAEAAAGSATGAAGSAQAAAGSKSDAEAYAVGKRGGEDVGSTDPTYHNNAKYYAEQAGSSAEAAAQSAEDAQDVLNSIPEDYSQMSADVGDLKTQFNHVCADIINIDFQSATVIDGLINIHEVWTTTQPAYKSYAFAINAGDYYKLKVTAGAYYALIGLLKNGSLSNQVAPNWATGISGSISVDAGQTQELNIPPDCAYITITKYVDSDRTPDSAVLYGYKRIPYVDNTLTESGEAADSKITGDKIKHNTDAVNGISKSLSVDWIDNYVSTDNCYYTAEMVRVQSGNWTTLIFDATKINFIEYLSSYAAGSTAFIQYAFFNDTPSAGSLIVSETFKTINEKNTAQNITVPSNATYFMLSGRTATGASELVVIDDCRDDLLDKIDDNSDEIALLNSKIYPRQKGMCVCAHKGYAEEAPQNSIYAYEMACKKGAFAINMAQVRVSADGTLWVIHDGDISISTNGTGNVGDLHDSYIEGLLVNMESGDSYTDAQRRVPKVFDLLKMCVKYGTIPMIRAAHSESGSMSDTYDTAWAALFDEIKKYKLEDSVMFSGSVQQLLMVDTYFPNAPKVFYNAEDTTITTMISTLNLYDWRNRASVYPMVSPNVLNATDVTELRKNGYGLYSWANDQSQGVTCAEYGCDFVNADEYPGIVQGVYYPTIQQLAYEITK